MSEFYFPAVLNEGDGSSRAVVTAFNAASKTPVYSADSTHPNFDGILDGLRRGDPNVWGLFDVAKGLVAKFHTVTDRVSWDGTNVLWDGDPVHSVLADQLSRVLENGTIGDDAVALAKFWEKLESNPNEHSRTQAYDWLACHKFQITAEGDVVGFKGVVSEGDHYVSWARSSKRDVPSGFVNGEPVAPLSRVPQKVGDVVSMPRSEVVADPSMSCHRGLHVATHGYASGYGDVVPEVHVNPRDIVSVPTDASGEKVRACRYEVARVAGENPSVYETPVLRDSGDNYWAGDVGYTVR